MSSLIFDDRISNVYHLLKTQSVLLLQIHDKNVRFSCLKQFHNMIS